MRTARRSYLSLPPALESIRIYRETLRDYSSEELEDVYFHIDLLREPIRYRMVQMEMERRGLHPGGMPAGGMFSATWIERAPGCTRWPRLRAVYLAGLLFVLTAGFTALMLIPLWVFAVPLHFEGVQASLVYLILLPVIAPLGVAFGVRAGGFRFRTLASILGVVLAFWTFYRIGGWAAIMDPLYRAGGGSGGFFGGW